MDFVLVKMSRVDWEKFRDLVEQEQQRSMPDRKSRAQIAKDLVTRAHLSRSDRHNDETFQIVLALVAQASIEIDSSNPNFCVENVDEQHPHIPRAIRER